MSSVKITSGFWRGSIIFWAILFCYQHSQAQNSAGASASVAKVYPKLGSLIVKQKKAKDQLLVLQVQWMDTTFHLERKYTNIASDKAVLKKDNNEYEIFREEPWNGEGFVLPYSNCHGFGLAQSFLHEGIDAHVLFSPTTYVDPAALEVLLATAYLKQRSLDATSMRDLKQPLAPGSLLIFRDNAGVAVHTVFKGTEGFLSKNGRHEPRIYHQLEDIKMVYYDALTIDVYRMDAALVKVYLDEQLQAMNYR